MGQRCEYGSNGSLEYKMGKYIMRIELVESFHTIADGQGGYWEDRGYEWYAGIEDERTEATRLRYY
jgi:DMSO/TMAO reductase YedYZ molybdopterin-dependent catalytic subunit